MRRPFMTYQPLGDLSSSLISLPKRPPMKKRRNRQSKLYNFVILSLTTVASLLVFLALKIVTPFPSMVLNDKLEDKGYTFRLTRGVDSNVITKYVQEEHFGINQKEISSLRESLHNLKNMITSIINNNDNTGAILSNQMTLKINEDEVASIQRNVLALNDAVVAAINEEQQKALVNDKDKANTQEMNKQVRHKKKSAIFFNTFQNTNHTGYANLIIEDQLNKLNQQELLLDSTIYYSRLGDYKTTEFPTELCQNSGHRRCVEIAAQEEGDEVITLQHLFEYCSENQDDLAIYIHSKGSFTPTTENEILRNILMKAVTSNECLEMNLNTSCRNGSPSCCNTCSSQFHGLPAHYPGNMWVANCNYVSMLVPPNEFDKKKQSVVAIVKAATKAIEGTKNFVTSFNDGTTFQYHSSKSWMLESPSMLGIGRFAMEQWIGSHPYLKPCDVFSPKDGVPIFRYGTTQAKGINAETLTPRLQLAPGMNFEEFWEEKKFKLHPWFEKNGREKESKLLYVEAPISTGWFYSFWEKR